MYGHTMRMHIYKSYVFMMYNGMYTVAMICIHNTKYIPIVCHP